MSVWHCKIHGLYGGQIFCPSCGQNGAYVTFPAEPNLPTNNFPPTTEWVFPDKDQS